MAGKGYTDLKAFLSGFKPAFLYNHNKPKLWFYEDEELENLRKYPFVEGVNANLPDQTLYFQDQLKKQVFISKTADIKPDTPDYHETLGIALGYPPKASNFYAHHRSSTNTVGINFHGIGCVGSIEDLEEDIKWLWDTYPSHWGVEVSHNREWYSIKHGNYNQLHHACNQIKQKALAI